MDPDGGPPEQVAELGHSLRCAVCGAGNSLTSEARAHGWFRCEHCGAGAPVPGVGDFVVEGPKGEAWRVVRAGSSEIETDIGYVFDFTELVVLVVAADLFGSGMLEAIRIWADPGLVDRLWMALVVFVLLVAGIGLLGFLTRQRLVLRENELCLSRVTLGREWHRRRLDTTRLLTAIRAYGRPTVELQVPGSTHLVKVESAEAAKWLEGEILAAVRDARMPTSAERMSCPGCGGPMGLERELLAAQGLDCEHCGTGLVVTGGGIRLPPVRLSFRLFDHPEHPAEAPERRGEVLCWTLPSWASGHPGRLPLQVLLFVVLEAVLLAAVWIPALAVPVLKPFAISVAVAATGTMVYLVGLWLRWTFGRERFELAGSVLQHTIRVGPWSSRPVRIPLARILEAEGYDWLAEDSRGQSSPPPGDRARLRVQTATDEHCFDLVGEWKLGAVSDIIAALRPRLVDLGREVAA
jgi:hypothetical protein